MLTSLSAEPKVAITEKRWKELAIPWGKLYVFFFDLFLLTYVRFVLRYGGEEVTHIFTYSHITLASFWRSLAVLNTLQIMLPSHGTVETKRFKRELQAAFDTTTNQ